MDQQLATLDDLFPEERQSGVGPFMPGARYFAPMDCVIHLQEDEPYRADRVDEYLTLLWHPREDRAIGVKIKSCRYLFDRARVLAETMGRSVAEDAVLPMISVLELAFTVVEGAALTKTVEAGRQGAHAELRAKYDNARRLVGDTIIDVGRRVA